MILLEIIRDDGVSINVGDAAATFELIAKDGTGTVDVETFYQERGAGYGDIKTGQRVKGRTFAYTLSTRKNVEWARYMISSFFNVTRSYTIRSYQNGKSVWVDADLVTVKPPTTLYGHVEAEITFYAADPFWKALSDNRKRFNVTTGLWHYPYALVALDAELPEAAYTAYEQVDFVRDLSIFYDGDVPALPIIMLMGPVTDPRITINGHPVTFTGDVPAGQKLIMDLGQSIYTLNGTNVFSQVSVVGDVSLKAGDNHVVSQEDQFGVVIYYKQYNGDV